MTQTEQIFVYFFVPRYVQNIQATTTHYGDGQPLSCHEVLAWARDTRPVIQSESTSHAIDLHGAFYIGFAGIKMEGFCFALGAVGFKGGITVLWLWEPASESVRR